MTEAISAHKIMHAPLDFFQLPLQLGWSHMTSSNQWTLNGSDKLPGKDH